MSACERCWRMASASEDKVDAYHRLLKLNDCTPEEQAGDDATECGKCMRRTRHQHTGECMACGEVES